MENIESNRLIAEFMGVESYEGNGYTNFIFNEDNDRAHVDLHYHASWDWLMPVVAKCKGIIDSYEFDSEEGMKCEEIFDIDYTYHNFMDNQIGEIHERVVEFIQWYNNQNNK
jgi:hypothetical protein